MVRFFLAGVFVAGLVLSSVADDPKGPKKKELDPKEQAKQLEGVWINEALATSKEVDKTRLHVALNSPQFDKDGGVQLSMSIKIWNKTGDGGGGNTVMLLKDDDKWLLSVRSAGGKFKGLPAAIPFRVDGDKLILVVKDGDWKNEYVLKRKWDK